MKHEKDVVLLLLGAAIVAWLVLRRGSAAAPAAAVLSDGDGVAISFPQAAATSPDYLTFNMPTFAGGLATVAPLSDDSSSSSAGSSSSKDKHSCGCGGCCPTKGNRFASSINQVAIPDSVTDGSYVANMVSAFPQTAVITGNGSSSGIQAGGGSGVSTPVHLNGGPARAAINGYLT